MMVQELLAERCLQCPMPVQVAELHGRVLIVERKAESLEGELSTRIDNLARQLGENGAHSLAAIRKIHEMVLAIDADVKDMRSEVLEALGRAAALSAERARERRGAVQ